MKQVSILIISLLTALTVISQSTALTITVYGNKNLQLSIDGNNLAITEGITTGGETTLILKNLAEGQHSLQVTRTNQNTNRPDKITTVFILRPGFNLLIKLNPNSSLELIETRNAGAIVMPAPMNTYNFNALVKNVKSQRSASARRNVIVNAFNNTGNAFTTNQVGQLLSLVNSESFRIQLAKQAYPLITDKGNFYLLYSLLNSEDGRNELADFVYAYENSTSNNAMSEADFNLLYQNIRQQWPLSAQMNSLVNAFNNTANYFTTYQAGRLIQLVTAESNRLQLAKLSYRSITDRNNFYQIYDLLNTQASKNELEAYVNNYNSGGTPGTAMSDANFNALYQSIQNQWPLSAQMNSLVNAFNNTANYFTTYQAGRLIQLVTAESNRLQLAKLSYRSITDRNNFYQIYELLTTQASKNELEAYVNSYSGGSGTNTPMSDANFNSLYQTIQNQWPVSAQMNSLVSAFNNTANYFSTYQASRLIQLVTAEANRLQLAKLSYRSITDRNNFYQVFDLLNTQASRNELQAYINSYSGGGDPNPPMSDANFNALYQTIQNQWPVSTQMNSLVNAFNNSANYFTTYQASRLIQLVSTESNRLQLAKLSYRSITDRANFTQIYSLLNTQASKDELAAYVNNYTGGTGTVKVPMADAEFNSLYQSIQLKFLPYEKMTSLTDLFTNTTSYFTTAQAKKLIALVSLESNRLQLAKLSYRTITDRENFSQMYDLFNSQASKDELDAYVRAYHD